jgi:hypothetical protein
VQVAAVVQVGLAATALGIMVATAEQEFKATSLLLGLTYITPVAVAVAPMLRVEQVALELVEMVARLTAAELMALQTLVQVAAALADIRRQRMALTAGLG